MPSISPLCLQKQVAAHPCAVTGQRAFVQQLSCQHRTASFSCTLQLAGHGFKIIRQTPCQRTTVHAGATDSVEAIIADVLNANKAQLHRPADLLAIIDSTGNGIQTTVKRSWDSTGVNLTLQGTWAKTAEARKMAMLAVYQERFVARAAAILRLVRWLAAQRQGLLEDNILKAVEQQAAANELNPAVEALQVPQLTLIAAAVYPWWTLQQVVEEAVKQARQTLFNKPPYNYSSSKKQAALQQLMWVEASLCRGAAMARLRALLLQQGKLEQWQQAAAAAGGAENSTLRQLTPEQLFHEAWKQQQQQLSGSSQQPAPAAAAPGLATAAAAGQGRCLQVSFHSRSSSRPWLLHSSWGLAAGDRAPAVESGSAAAAAAAAEGGVAEVSYVCHVLQQLTVHIRQLKAAVGSTDQALGVLPEVQSCHRVALLDLLVCWAETSPALQAAVPAPVAAAKVAVSSPEHDRLLRRIAIEASGPEVQVLRQLARTKGWNFLMHFSPAGNPFGRTSEWDYFRDCPGVFTRFVVDPPTTKATLTFKQPGQPQQHPKLQQQQQQSAPVQQQLPALAAASIELSQLEIQQLLQQLVLVLSGSSSSSKPSRNLPRSSSSGSSSEVGQPGTRQVQLLLVSSTGSSSTAGADISAGAGSLQLLIDGAVAAELAPHQVASLVTVMEDLMRQLPDQYQLSQPPVQVVPAPPWQQALRSGLSWLSSSGRAVAAAALLAVPLVAIIRPFRGLQHVPAAAPLVTEVPDSNGTVTRSSIGGGSSSGTSRKRVQPVNDDMSESRLQELCSIIASKLAGKVWLPETLAYHQQESAATKGDSTCQLPQHTEAPSAGSDISSTAAVPGTDRQPVMTPTVMTNTDTKANGASTGSLMYQVVVCRGGGVMGVKPCGRAAAAAYTELPLVSELLKSPALQRVQQKRMQAILIADAKGSKRLPKPSRSQVTHGPVQTSHLPPDGAVVLKLVLQPHSSDRSSGNDAQANSGYRLQDASSQTIATNSSRAAQQHPQQQQQESGIRVVGSGKSVVKMVLMDPVVTPWTDADSLTAWQLQGAVLQPKQQQQTDQQHGLEATQLGAPSGSSASNSKPGGLSLNIDGKEVESLEALVQQLLAAHSQQAGAQDVASTAAAPQAKQ